MSGCHQGKAKVFVYDLMSLKVTSRTLQGRRLRTADLHDSRLYFLELRNNKQQDYNVGNCFVAIKMSGLTFLVVTYAVDFGNKVLHPWKLKKGKTIDCSCQHPDNDCRTRLCGFTSRYQPMTVGFSVVRFYFLNQLNSTDSVFGLPRDDVYDKASGEYHCSLTNCDTFFAKRDLVPRMVGIELGRRGTGSFQLQLPPAGIPSKKIKQRDLSISDGTSSVLDSLGNSFDPAHTKKKIQTVFSVIEGNPSSTGNDTFLSHPFRDMESIHS